MSSPVAIRRMQSVFAVAAVLAFGCGAYALSQQAIPGTVIFLTTGLLLMHMARPTTVRPMSTADHLPEPTNSQSRLTTLIPLLTISANDNEDGEGLVAHLSDSDKPIIVAIDEFDGLAQTLVMPNVWTPLMFGQDLRDTA